MNARPWLPVSQRAALLALAPAPALHARDRGTRRIVAGGNPRVSGECDCTGDHYRGLRRIGE